MSESRYRESRTLVRRICRLPGEDRAEFKGKVRRLRAHFQRFNADAAELCQWIFGLRKSGGGNGRPDQFGALGDFVLTPAVEGVQADEVERDRWRLAVFDGAAGIQSLATLGEHPAPRPLREAVAQEVARAASPTAEKLFGRMRQMEAGQRLVLLKAAAEWVVARYLRAAENWQRQREEWAKEKTAWEAQEPHAALTAAVRDRFTAVFKALVWDESKKPGVRSKRPRICPWSRLRENVDNCIWAGEKGHGPLCWAYEGFKAKRKEMSGNFNETRFAADAAAYVELRAGGLPASRALERVFRGGHEQRRFQNNWTAYLQQMGLNETRIIAQKRLPHCLSVGKLFRQSECLFNPHTALCERYKRALQQFDDETLKLEPLYRAWRKDYLAGPKKPSFRYPSSRELPIPKIFGAGFHEIDLERSVLRLRLDGMASGEWLEFGVVPWPRGYDPAREEAKSRITSVHVHFIGSRARAGFRLDAPHAASRLACTQDELDRLRSCAFPRRSQDQQFVDAAREQLLKTFSGDAERELRVLAVDLGRSGACAAVYEGRTHVADVPLAINKIDKLYEALPETLEIDKRRSPEKPPPFKPDDTRGVRAEHVGRHLASMAAGASQIAEHRAAGEAAGGAGSPVTLKTHDFRGLTRHVRWMIRDWVRLNAAQVIALAERHGCDVVVFESLRGFLPGARDERDKSAMGKKRWLATFAYGAVRRKATEKAVERGMRVVTTPYHGSSQTCSACGHFQENRKLWEKNKRSGRFECQCGGDRSTSAEAPARPAQGANRAACACKASVNSDANAARVIARVFWGGDCAAQAGGKAAEVVDGVR
ncbi:putative transposase DNA-binding domain protein [Phycisphaerae bacterium RAS1]|nr:putative transposase DNA-binding domain protein [Phycisphaerae bacterium RAS1]